MGQHTPLSPLPQRRCWCLRQRDVTPGERHSSHITTRLAVPGSTHVLLRRAPSPSPKEELSWDPQEDLWFHPHPQAVWAGGCWGRGCWDFPLAQHTCTSPQAPLIPHRQPLLRRARAHTGLIGHLPAALAASVSPAPTPCEPSWKAVSFMPGGAGGWAWEAPRVSRMVPLLQPLPAPAAQWGHHLSSHTCAMGLCTRKHILSLSLAQTYTQRPTHQYLNSLTVPKKANTHKSTGSVHTNS